jgi:tRNA pseudouridine13 synthase
LRLKQRIGDFRVRELLTEGYLVERGDHRVYRITKRKLTTPEAIDALAGEAGVESSEVGLAGWKDRQGITIQYMSVRRGRPVEVQAPELRIATAGFAREPYSSDFSSGNAFELNVRCLLGEDIARLRKNLPLVREHGLIDYFDDQRFGNLTHGQGWIVKDLMLGRAEEALKSFLTARSPHDDDHRRRFKEALHRNWGDWRACRDVAGKFGAHHSVFEHLNRSSDDFAGAFEFVSTRLRLIHLYAWQSHLWNRAVADHVRSVVPLEERVLLDSEEGVLVTHGGAPPARTTFRLPGEGLDDVEDPVELTAYEEVLAQEGMVPDQLRLEGASGFRLKGEERSLVVRPRHLRVRPAEEDPLNRGTRMVRVRFELPRGSYASLVVKRLFQTPHSSGPSARDRGRDRSEGRREWKEGGRERGGGQRYGNERGRDRRDGGRSRPWQDRPHGGRRDDRDGRDGRRDDRDAWRGGGRRDERGGVRPQGDRPGGRRDDRGGDRREGRGGQRSQGAPYRGPRDDREDGRRGGRRGEGGGGRPQGDRYRGRREDPGGGERRDGGGGGRPQGDRYRGRRDERGGGERRDERGGYGRQGERYRGRRDERGGGERRDERGGHRRQGEGYRGRRDERGGGERRDERGGYGRQGERYRGRRDERRDGDRGGRREDGRGRGGREDRRRGGGGTGRVRNDRRGGQDRTGGGARPERSSTPDAGARSEKEE